MIFSSRLDKIHFVYYLIQIGSEIYFFYAIKNSKNIRNINSAVKPLKVFKFPALLNTAVVQAQQTLINNSLDI